MEFQKGARVRITAGDLIGETGVVVGIVHQTESWLRFQVVLDEDGTLCEFVAERLELTAAAR